MNKAKTFKLLLYFSSIIAIFTSCSNNGQVSSDLQTITEGTTFSNPIISNEATQMTVQTTSEQTVATTTQVVTTTISQEPISTTVQTPQTTLLQTSQTMTSEMTTTQITTESSATLTSDVVVPIEYPSLASLTDDETFKLKEDFAKYKSSIWTNPTSEEMTVMYYYGKYNGNEVVVMYSIEYTMTDDEKYVDVGEYTFTLPSGSLEILLHIDSDFIDIQTAYASGYLNDEDIAAIYYYANNQ